jgi:hypothetical protein
MEHSNAGTYKKILLLSVSALVALAILLTAALTRYLATPHAAAQISRILSDTLGQPVVIQSAAISDGALQLKGLSLANPEGFPPTKLLSIDSITIAPLWLKLLSNNRTFERIAVEGITADLRRNSAGIWNFDALQRRLSSSKPSPAGVFIRHLTIRQGTVQINDRRIAGLALNISNLATRGSEKAGFNLEFDDPGRNHYVLSGRGRLGGDPEIEMRLTSAAISLKSLSEAARINNRYLPEQGNADLLLSAELRKGLVRGRGKIGFSAAALPAAGRGDAFSGTISLSAGYDVHKDLLSIEDFSVHLNRLLAVRASGSVQELKQARRFELDVKTDEVDIGTVAVLIPELKHSKTAPGGRLEKGFLHLSGNAADGITGASGTLGLSHGVLRQGGRLFFNDLNVTAALSGTGDVLTVTGKATQARPAKGAILETLDLPFRVTLNRQLTSIKARSRALSARARGVSFTGSLSYADGTALLENAAVTAGDLSVRLGRLSARMPLQQTSTATVRYPLQADFSGCDLQRGDALLKRLSGSVRGAYAYDQSRKWLEGTADLKLEKAAWQGKESGAATVRARFSESGGRADFAATLLGGSVTGEALFNPFALQEKVGFTINAHGITLTEIMKLAGQRGGLRLTGGTLDAGCSGSYSRSAGLDCHLEASGRTIAVSGERGKTVLTAGGIRLDSDLSGRKLIINKALLTAGKDIAVTASGVLENAFLPGRQGRIDFSVPTTALAGAVDTFLTILPRWIQEAAFEGSLAAEGAVNLTEGTVLVAGAVTLADVTIDAPSEKIKLSGTNGVLPLSLDLAGKTAVKPPLSPRFNRQNYDTLVKQLPHAAEKGDTITINSASFGGLRMESVKIRLKAAGGVTEIMSLDSSLFEGALLGKGFVTMHNGIIYRGDLLFNDLSLVQICKAFPAITGYISGRVDGIVSFQGKGRRLSDISGFTEFWARGTSTEKMLVSREFLQRLSGKKLSGFFFSTDRAYNHAAIKAALENGYLTFDSLDISHTNFLGIRDLSVSIAPSQNRIAMDHLLNSIREATVRGKGGATGAAGKDAPADAPPATEFKWDE